MEDTAANTHTKVLCIEDEHFISELYARALTKAGYEVKMVIDGSEGLKEAQTDQYDIILLDIMLPTITGLDILDILRGPSAQAQIKAKIVVATNLEQGEAARATVEEKADGYIIKADMTPKELVDFFNQFRADA